ncbi:hypothetical protein AB0M45_09020 [Nocardia sp. NPDC051787]|uniref:hypothetical protein n=1 Tax=Nocardia sp. NPDC051787 TaxID=3155415 RepID=UPI003444A86E
MNSVQPALLTLAAEAQDLLFREARTANTCTDGPVGKPDTNAWFPRSPRLDYDEVVSTIRAGREDSAPGPSRRCPREQFTGIAVPALPGADHR